MRKKIDRQIAKDTHINWQTGKKTNKQPDKPIIRQKTMEKSLKYKTTTIL